MIGFDWIRAILNIKPAPPPPLPPPPDPTDPIPRLRRGVVAEVNRVRQLNRLDTLVEVPTLAAIAQLWADRTARAGWDHLDPHGGFAARLQSVFPDRSSAENIAWGQLTPQTVVAGWLNSPPHRAKLLGDFTIVGAGVAAAPDGRNLYWCLDLVR